MLTLLSDQSDLKLKKADYFKKSISDFILYTSFFIINLPLYYLKLRSESLR